LEKPSLRHQPDDASKQADHWGRERSASAAHQQGRLHGTLSGIGTEGPGHMPLYWLCYRHNNSIFVVIEPAHSLIHARLRASIDGLDQGEFTEGHDEKWES
jgi:hypothetical protein